MPIAGGIGDLDADSRSGYFLDNVPNIRLTMLPLADCSGGGTCVGPFQLLQNGPHVSVSLNIVGDILNNRNSATPDITPFTGLITAQFLNTSVGTVFAGANSPAGVSANSWSGSISAAAGEIPEPETMTLLGIGLVAILLGRLRAKHRANVN
jgi:hypothetical protein